MFFFILSTAEKILAEPPIDQIQQIGSTLMRFFNPFEISREAIHAAGDVINAGSGNTKLEEFYVPATNSKKVKSEEYSGRYNYGIDVLCNGKEQGYDCRGEDWDPESESTFKYGVNDLQYLTHDLHGVVPSDVQWFSSHVNIPAEHHHFPHFCDGPHCAIDIKNALATGAQALASGGLANPISVLSGGLANPISALSGGIASPISALSGGVSAGIATAFALPAALIAAKLAKPFAWKLAIAAKVAFLKLVFLKKILLVTGKIAAIKLIKGAFLAFPFLIVPILKGLGFFKLISVALGGGLKHLDCMFHRFGPCENHLSHEESLMMHVLPWFAQHREIVNNDASDIFRMPSEIVENFSLPSDIVVKDFIRSLPHIGLTPDSFAEIAQVLAGNVGNVASLLKPNLRKLQKNSVQSEVPSYEDATELQQVIQGVVNDLLGGFSSALQTYQELRKEYNQFTDFALQENPGLMERSLKEEMTFRLAVPQPVLQVIDTDVSLFDNSSMAGQRASVDMPSVDDIDFAFRSLAKSIQGKEKIEDQEEK